MGMTTMSARDKIVAIGMMVIACIAVYRYVESVFRMRGKTHSATLGAWFRRKLYRRGYCIVKENCKVECCGNGEGIVLMMVACYQSLRNGGLTKEELRIILETDKDKIVEMTDTTWEERDE